MAFGTGSEIAHSAIGGITRSGNQQQSPESGRTGPLEESKTPVMNQQQINPCQNQTISFLEVYLD